MVVHELPWAAAGSSGLAKESFLESPGSLCFRRMNLSLTSWAKVQSVDTPSDTHGDNSFP